MAAALSVDLRERVVAACVEEGLTYEEAASQFGVGYATVNRWLRLQRETQQLAPKPLPGRTPRIDEFGQALVRKLVSERPDATIVELADAYASVVGARLAPCIMHRALVRLGLTRKKRQCTPPKESALTSCYFDGTTNVFAVAPSGSAADCSSSTKAE